MGNFNNDRSDRGRGDDNRGNRAPQMHSATCNKCGKSCQVPFRPTGNRPIFCNECFRSEGGSSTQRSYDRGSQSGSDRPMFDATCAKCGNRCQIPFQPRTGKEVFCSHCFEQNARGGSNFENRAQNNDQLDEVNAKLDKILELLNPRTTPAKKVVRQEQNLPLEEKLGVIAEEVFEAPVKKASVKKKAAPKKKTVVKVE